MRGAAFAVLMMLAGQDGPPAAPPAPDIPVSVERIREGLQRPTLKIPPVEAIPVFRATIDEKPFDNPLQGMRRELEEFSGYSRRSGVDVLPLVMGIVKSIRSARRAHAEAEIRKEVQEALNAFCAEHDCSALSDGPPPMEGIILPHQKPPTP
jgi:hypothetical protein